MKLSEDLTYWRAERPDEWTMDRFIMSAKNYEEVIAKAIEYLTTISSADGSGHADLARSLERMINKSL